jgi:hypothetical protein
LQKLKMLQGLLNMALGTSDRQDQLNLMVGRICPIIRTFKDGFWSTATATMQGV